MELTSTQKIVIELLKKTKLYDIFYWTGGTLLSHYYFQHRYSLDLDFFSDNQFPYEILIPLLSALKDGLKTDIEEHKIYDRWEFIIKKPEITRIEFVYYNHEKKRLKPLQKYLGISIDSLDDIAANKTMAYFDRNEPKDLFDLYFLIIKGRFQVNQLLQMVEEKFGAKLSEFSFWSESTKSLKLLNTLQPILIQKSKEEQDKLLSEIKDYFLKNGSSFLNKRLD